MMEMYIICQLCEHDLEFINARLQIASMLNSTIYLLSKSIQLSTLLHIAYFHLFQCLLLCERTSMFCIITPQLFL